MAGLVDHMRAARRRSRVVAAVVSLLATAGCGDDDKAARDVAADSTAVTAASRSSSGSSVDSTATTPQTSVPCRFEGMDHEAVALDRTDLVTVPVTPPVVVTVWVPTQPERDATIGVVVHPASQLDVSLGRAQCVGDNLPGNDGAVGEPEGSAFQGADSSSLSETPGVFTYTFDVAVEVVAGAGDAEVVVFRCSAPDRPADCPSPG